MENDFLSGELDKNLTSLERMTFIVLLPYGFPKQKRFNMFDISSAGSLFSSASGTGTGTRTLPFFDLRDHHMGQYVWINT